MASIEDVIARSQKPGEFTGRKEFSIARGQAIRKLRKFALVDPHYYILELIQSAIANGATYIDIRSSSDHIGLSYVGGYFQEASLGQLFDFLFASEDDLEHGPLRQLALGVNALMRFEPDEIVIESGNGSLAGTTRVVIRGSDDVVEVGKPDEPLEGTYLTAGGMQRGEMENNSTLKRKNGNMPEYAAVMDRCLVAPVPILFNDDPLFGYSRQRVPESPFGLTRTVSFDEGDLYGTIGVAHRHSGAVFRMLTYGVWIESARHHFETRRGDKIQNVGGIITYDRLRKTADHSAIVEDERYHEMWIRLKPYVNELFGDSKTTSSGQGALTLEGEPIEDRELLDLLRDSDTVVLVPRRSAAEGDRYDSARKIGESLGAPVLCASEANRKRIRMLGGGDVRFVVPDLETEVHFYTQNEAPLPERPWLTAPVDLGSFSVLDLVEDLPKRLSRIKHRINTGAPEAYRSELVEKRRKWLAEPERVEDLSMEMLLDAQWLLHWDPNRGDPEALEEWIDDVARPDKIRASIYVPQRRDAGARDANVEVRTANRIVWRGDAESLGVGQVLVIDVDEISPHRLWDAPDRLHESRTTAALIAEAVARTHLSEIERASERALRAAIRTGFEPGTNAAKLVLSSLSHRLVKRIREGSPRVRFSVVDFDLEGEVLDTPLLETLSGRAVSLRDLEQLMEQCHGMVYAAGADEESAIVGLNTDRILVVDETLERILISLVGPGAYTRVDERDVLAEYTDDDGYVVWCVDVAIGLRDFPDFPLLVEETDPTGFTNTEQDECIHQMVAELIERVKTRPDGDPWQTKLRRQAWRHLQWFAMNRGDYVHAQWAGVRVEQLPLFEVSNGRTCSFAVLRDVLEERGHVEMLDGWARDAGKLSFDEAVDRQITSPDPESFRLAMDPFALHLLGDRVKGAAEYALSERELENLDEPEVASDAMLHRRVLDNPEVRGVVGVPRERIDRPVVIVFSGDETVLREDLGESLGVVGKLRLRSGIALEDVRGKPERVARSVLENLLARLPEFAGDRQHDYERALEVLLEFAGEQVRLVATANRTVEMEVGDGLARQILEAPLLPGRRNTPVSAMSLYREFRERAGTALARREAVEFQPRRLADDLPGALSRWMNRYLTFERIDTHSIGPDVSAPAANNGEQDLAKRMRATIEYWLNELHPDTDVDGGRLHVFVELNRELFEQWGIADQFCQLVKDNQMLGDRGAANDRLLVINPDHWMTRWIVDAGPEADRQIAWAVLAAYGHINELLERVTDDHELICQQRLADALADGRLQMM